MLVLGIGRAAVDYLINEAPVLARIPTPVLHFTLSACSSTIDAVMRARLPDDAQWCRAEMHVHHVPRSPWGVGLLLPSTAASAVAVICRRHPLRSSYAREARKEAGW